MQKMKKVLFVIPDKSYNSQDFVNSANKLGIDMVIITDSEQAAQQLGAKNIYLLGFDLATVGKPLSNVHLLPDYNKGFDSTMWQNQMKTVMRKFKNVNFYWVSQEEHKNKFQGISNLKFVTMEDLEKWIDQME